MKLELSKRRKRQEIRPEHLLNDSGLRIGFWDIEAGGLSGTFAGLLVVGFKEAGKGKPVTILRIDESSTYKKEPWNDKEIAYEAKKELEKFDILVSYNGISYDTRFLDTRLVYHGIKPLSTEIKHCDLYKTVRGRLKLHSNRLEAVLSHLATPDRKTPLTAHVWQRGVAGSKPDLDLIVDHNKQDVIALEQAFNKLASLIELKISYV